MPPWRAKLGNGRSDEHVIWKRHVIQLDRQISDAKIDAGCKECILGRIGYLCLYTLPH